MKLSHLRHLLVLFILLPLALTACGDGSSDKDVTATNFPYGADSTLVTITESGETIQVTYDYNQAMQVIGSTTVMEEHGDIDGKDGVVYRQVNTMTVDPSITTEYDLRDRVERMTQRSRERSFGTITSLVESRYHLNEETGILETTPYRRSEERYKYSASGRLIEEIEISTRDAETTTHTRKYSYNSAGDLTRKEYVIVNPTSINSSYSELTEIEYDSYGHPVSQVYTHEGDQNGDGTDEPAVLRRSTYVNSYDNNLLTRTVATLTETESDDETYQVDYAYTPQGQLITSTKSTNIYGDDDKYDTFNVHTYTYDSAGRLLSDSEENSYDNNNDGILENLSRTNLTWEYNQDGLMTTYSRETINYSDPAEETLSSHSKSEYRYHYSSNGNISRRTYESLRDSDLDGDCEETTNDWSYNYSYNSSNYLSAYTRESHSYNAGEISSTATDEQTLIYTDGVLSEVEMTETSSYDDEPNHSLTRLSYDSNEKLSQYETQHNRGTETINLTYNDDQTVTFVFQHDDEERMSMKVDFGTEGLPSGSTDFSIDPLTIRYPNTPEHYDHLNDLANVADENDKVYPFNVKTPKIMMFIINSEMGVK